MKIISLKRNAGDAIGYDKEKEGYEITYRTDSDSKISNVSIGLESAYGKQITEAAQAVSRGTGTQAQLQEILIEAVEENTSAVMQKVLDEVKREKNSEFISSRISLIDGAELRIGENVVTGALASHIMAMVKARRQDKNSVKTDDWLALINFTELLYDNVDSYVREQLYGWLMYQVKNGRLTLTPEGKFLGYKGCMYENENIVSIHSGPGIVNGEATNGHLINNPGTVIEMARDSVDSDPNSACSTGLHVGSFDYAQGFSQGAIVLVEVDPRDVVSVPVDSNNQKIRACKYRVIREVEDELTEFSVDFTEDELSKDDLIENELSTSDDEVENVYYNYFESCLANDKTIEELLYMNADCETSLYKNVKVKEVNDDRILVTVDGNKFRTFVFKGILSVKGLEGTLSVDNDMNELDLEPGDVISYLEYKKVDGSVRYYDNEMLVEKVTDDLVTVSLDDNSIKMFKIKGITDLRLN